MLVLIDTSPVMHRLGWCRPVQKGQAPQGGEKGDDDVVARSHVGDPVAHVDHHAGALVT